MGTVNGDSADDRVPAVKGVYTGIGSTFTNDRGIGVEGYSENGFGVYGSSKVGRGVVCRSDTNYALRAHSKTASGARCSSDAGYGVEGEARGAGIGVVGTSDSGIGVLGESKNNEGVRGVSHNPHAGVVGINDAPLPGGNGGWFESSQGEGVRGWSKNPNHGGVVGVNAAGGVGVYGEGRVAGFFKGDVEVTGDIRLIHADCAEDFDISGAETIEPGTVMVLCDEGALQPSDHAYDKRVAGVLSGAGGYKPGIVLDKQQSRSNRKPLALLGKVYCKVDAQYGAVEMGDLLTTSPTAGHAMKADDPLKAFGAVIGKALRPLKEGQGLIPILIALQ
jgi:hypothetical protein